MTHFRTAAAAVVAIAGVALAAGPASPAGATDVSLCETADEFKIDDLDGDTYTVPDWRPAYRIVAVSVKAGPSEHLFTGDALEGTTLDVKAVTGYAVSHVHLCKVRVDDSTTTTEPATTTELPTTTEAPTTTEPTPTTPPTEPAPAADASVVCTSTSPTSVSWQLTNTGDVAIVSPVALAPGESAVIESLAHVEGTVTVTVTFADDSTGTFVGSGEGCVFTPPATTTPPSTPTTTVSPATTDPATTPSSPSSPTTTPSNPNDPPASPSARAASATLPATGLDDVGLYMLALGGLALVSGTAVLITTRRRP